MWVMDVRLTPEPAVRVVTASGNRMAATLDERVPHVDARRPRARRRLADHLTPGDIDLLHAVTGESIWPGMTDAAVLSPFAAQIAHDRLAGRLPPGEEVTARYLLLTGRVIAANGGRNPFTGLLLERALAHLGVADGGHVDVSC